METGRRPGWPLHVSTIGYVAAAIVWRIGSQKTSPLVATTTLYSNLGKVVETLVRARILIITAVAALGLLAGAGPASAHSSLVTASPQRDAVLDQSPSSIDLTFDQDVSDRSPVIVLSDSAGRDIEVSQPSVSGPFVTAPISSELEPGVFTVSFGVDSADGDPVTGDFTFEVVPEGTGQLDGQGRTDAPPTGPVLADVSAAMHKGSDGLNCGWLWGSIAGAIMLLAAGIGMFYVIGARKARNNDI